MNNPSEQAAGKRCARENFGGPYDWHNRRSLLQNAQKCWPTIR